MTGRTTPRRSPVDKIIEEVVLGRHDERIGDIFAAINARAAAGILTYRWVIEWDGLVAAEDDLTVGEACQIEDEVGENWSMIDPARSAHQCRAVLNVLGRTRLGLSEADAAIRADSVPATRILSCVRKDLVQRPEGETVPFGASNEPPIT